MMHKLNHEVDASEIADMIREADMDDDGKISFQEFKKIMLS